MPQCCFAGCHNRTDDGRGLSFFRFPRRDVARTKAWVQACGREAFVPSQHSRVCSQHFSPDDFERDIRSELLGSSHRRLRLKDTAVPTKALGIKSSQEPKEKVNRNSTSPVKVDEKETHNETNTGRLAEKRKSDHAASKLLEPPLKKKYFEGDVLDLSKKQVISYGIERAMEKDEDELMLDSLCEEMEKENAPSAEFLAKSKSLIHKMEDELRNEESTLFLLKQLRANQRSHALQLKGTKTPQAAPTPPKPLTLSDRTPININPQRAPSSLTTSRVSQPSNVNSCTSSTSVTPSQSTPKVTKAMAVQALEQQYNGKKLVLQKHLERTLDKVTLPRPPGGNSFSDIAFVPSTWTNEFTYLFGLEEVVGALQDYDAYTAEKADQSLACDPFICARCGTDFTPVWKRKRPGSTEVVCEACIIYSQRSSIYKSYNNVVSAALKQYASSEHEIDQEYQDILNTPVKLETFIREQERKLASTQQAQQQQQQQLPTNNTTANPRFHQAQNFQAQNAFTGTRHVSNTNVSNAAAVHITLPNNNVRRQSSSTLVSSASAPVLSVQQQQQSQVAAASVAHQLASQYQQLSKVVAAAAGNAPQAQTNYSVSTNPVNVAASMMMAAASTQQQQQAAAAAAVLQQRLAAAAALGELQQQQPQAQASTVASSSSLDQFNPFTQMQALLMNSLLCSAANQATGNRQQQQPQQQMLQQALFQYAFLLQQQQQQQQQAAAAAQAQQQQQQQQVNAAALQQLMGGATAGAGGNSAAAISFLTNLWNLNAASGAVGKKSKEVNRNLSFWKKSNADETFLHLHLGRGNFSNEASRA
ncbi:hypothetical protein EG68_00653 [Paragonimus skrjabini miyazakii]|uniref:Transcriptional repressor p66-beta n=1 Tax=Paragonimus skrjabini miyazakii TaxID=59628 RepID=A0A8S9Z8P6_9TREM|nr:hypothetical protein EG68_00653 [Paragonimus skrjabini miyazakii]